FRSDGAPGTQCLADEEVAAGLDGPGERRHRPRRAARRRVLHRPAIEVDSRIGAVVELDEVLLVGGAGVAAAAVDLGDDDAVDGFGIRVATVLADVNGRSGVAWRG